MHIFLNGNSQPLNDNCTITTLIQQLNLQNKRLAVEVNSNIIPRSQFDTYILKTADKVEIVHAIGGG